ncbi:winged helix-turn-helix transcriptional regulator [Enterobacter chuandaensis]|uniref:Winged helix-turn-helix transcriptional regulator n=1 Tax=Enterobacter chuandaensis TaxID=2497875 RepID=A0AA96MAQ6_9ENTR|nr:winged helix-turn-helix transcriptional regulator [Enterobacter chuandaensis]WNS39973.1 winged helix-turn-helix transcriptional regulator [Enterobacter chuandaensis]
MTITIREQVLAALRNNPGLSNAKLAGLIGMDTKKISGTVSTLLADGLISCEGKYGQRLYSLTSYGMKYAPETIPAMPKGNSKLVQRTETNVICQECRNSPAMRRVLMVWGRVGV